MVLRPLICILPSRFQLSRLFSPHEGLKCLSGSSLRIPWRAHIDSDTDPHTGIRNRIQVWGDGGDGRASVLQVRRYGHGPGGSRSRKRLVLHSQM